MAVAFRLRPDESVSRGLKRVVRRELRKAIDQLRGGHISDEVVHEARKSIKKLRAVVQLVGDEIHAGRAEKQLRRAARSLAPLRDADAIVASARALCRHQPRELSVQTCASIRERMQERKARVGGRKRAIHRAIVSLKQARRSTKQWKWSSLGFSHFEADIRDSYKKARSAMRKARTGKSAVTFHEWRKRVKTLWYALRLLPRHVQPLGRRLNDLERLETWLGDDHNLMILRDQLVPKAHIKGRVRLKQLAHDRQLQLRRKALRLGARQFGDAPKAFTRSLRPAA
jgi:hypothetical protein